MTNEELEAFLAAKVAEIGPHVQAEITPRFANAPRLRRCTVEDVIVAGPCGAYPESKVRKLADLLPAGPLTVIQVVSGLRGRIPDADLLWVATLPCWYERPDVVLRWLAADFAAMALPEYEARERSRAPRNCVTVSRLLALGAIEWGSAAWSAAESAGWSAARSAARSVARSVARIAAWVAARGAAENAAWSAAWGVARSAPWSAALDRLLAVAGGTCQ